VIDKFVWPASATVAQACAARDACSIAACFLSALSLKNAGRCKMIHAFFYTAHYVIKVLVLWPWQKRALRYIYHIISYHIISYHIISYHIISYILHYIIYFITHWMLLQTYEHICTHNWSLCSWTGYRPTADLSKAKQYITYEKKLC